MSTENPSSRRQPDQPASHRFSQHTTARVGGAATDWITADTEDAALDVLARHPLPSAEERAAGRDTLLVLGGGSNLIVADTGFAGTVLHLDFTGIALDAEGPEHATVTVAAGHSWDDAVAWTVEQQYAGLEALSGIPGSTGATPVQNVGAYGADVSQTLIDVRAWDRLAAELVTLSAEDLDFGYRDSLLKRTTVAGSPRYVVLSVRFRLQRREGRALSSPVRYGELARSLGMTENAAEDSRRAPLADVRDHVLRLRAGKGMVLDPDDHDTWSTGSFFTNPIVAEETAGDLPEGAPRFHAGTDSMGRDRVKLSAAWLIDQAGCEKGYGVPAVGGRASLSTKHTLAVTNRGGASTEDLLSVARSVRDRVRERFGIDLHPEPVLVGCRL